MARTPTPIISDVQGQYDPFGIRRHFAGEGEERLHRRASWSPEARQARVDYAYANQRRSSLVATSYGPRDLRPFHRPYEPDMRSNRGQVTVDAEVVRKRNLPPNWGSFYSRLPPWLKQRVRLFMLISRRLHPALNALDVIRQLIGTMVPPRQGSDTIPEGSGWTLCNAFSGCATPPEFAKHEGAPSSCPAFFGPECLDMQAYATLHALGADCDALTRALIWTSAPDGLDRVTHVRMWTRPDPAPDPYPSPTATPQPGIWYPPAELQMPNPNLLRFVNPTPQPFTTPASGVPAPAVATMVVTLSQPGAPPTPRPPRTIAPHKPAPPEPWTKERKTGVAKFGAALARILDGVSEAAEVVDAIYRALPLDVQQRWGCGGLDRPGDQMGQYGLEGADCKMQAIYWNYHRLDVRQAVANILTNELEDRLYGAAAAARDDVTFRGRSRRGRLRRRG